MARQIGLLLAGVLFIGGLYLSLTTISLDDVYIRWGYVATLVLLGASGTLVLNTLVFWLSARSVGDGCGFFDSLRLIILSSAANFLPIPGGAIVRVAALRGSGSSYRGAISITASAAMLWLSLALIVAGVGLAQYSSQSIYFILSFAGLIVGVAASMVARSVTRAWLTVLQLILVSLATHLVATFRFWLAFGSIGLLLPIMDSAVIAASGTAGAVVGIVPGGLGVNEAMAALLSELMGNSGALGFIAATINRLANYALRGPLALIFIWKSRA